MVRPLAALICAVTLCSALLTGCAGTDNSESLTARNVDIMPYRMQAGSVMPQLVESGVLRIGIDPNHPPFSYYNDQGRLTGFDVEIAEALAHNIGLEPHFVETDSTQMLNELGEGKYAIAMYKTASDELLQLYDLSFPYATSSAVILVKSDEQNIQSHSDLSGKRVAVPQEDRYKDLIEESGMNTIAYDNLQNGINQLKSGEVDAVLTDSLTYLNMSQQNPDLGVKSAAVSSSLFQSKTIVTKGSDDLLAAINNAITKINAGDHYLLIWNKYFADAPISHKGVNDIGHIIK